MAKSLHIVYSRKIRVDPWPITKKRKRTLKESWQLLKSRLQERR